jgi:hypothetical protein
VTGQSRVTKLGIKPDEYDYGASPHGSLIRHVHTDYQTFAATPIGGSILYKPADVITFDGNGNRAAETDYLYDTNSIAAVAALDHDDSQFPATLTTPRGNVTSITKLCFGGFASCANGQNTYSYNQVGDVISDTDANKNTTNYTYSDNYSTDNGTPSGNTYAFVTSIVEPPVNGVNFVSSLTYGYLDGKMRTSSDVNGKVTTYCYSVNGCSGGGFDPWFRSTQVSYPDGGQLTASYSDAGPNPSVMTSKLMSTSHETSTSTIMAERAKVRREVPDHTVQEEYARLFGEGARCDSSESQRKSGKSDQDAQPDHPWMGKLSPSYLGVFSVPEDGNGPLAIALAMGEVPPSKQDLCLDRKTILASAWRTEVVLRCGC